MSGGRFPNKTNMAESNPQRKLPNLAAHHSKKNVNKFFPESDETQQGHMRGQRQGVRSTKPKKNEKPQGIQTTLEEEKGSEKLQREDTRDTKPIKNENDILIEVYSPKETMYTYQTGKYTHVSSQGNRYMMVLAHIDSDSIWVEPMDVS